MISVRTSFFGGFVVLLATLKYPGFTTSHCYEHIMEPKADDKIRDQVNDFLIICLMQLLIYLINFCVIRQ